MKKNFHWLILYDVKNAKRLRKVSKIIESYGWRVQKSVFESNADPLTIETLKARLNPEICPEEDFILIFEVCEKDWQKKEKYGKHGEGGIQNEKFVILQ